MVISTHLPPPVMIESTAVRAATTHILCCSCAACFSAAASSENDQGGMNLASKAAPVAAIRPSRVRLSNGDLIAGDAPNRVLRETRRWLEENRADLLQLWNEFQR